MNVDSQPFYVLSVEGDPGDAIRIRAAFDKCESKAHLTSRSSYAEAEVLLASYTVDLLLTDFSIDTDAAVNFIAWVRRHYPLLPIVVLSRFLDPTPAYCAGAHAFIGKDTKMPMLVSNIEIVLHFWMHVASLPRSDGVRRAESRDTWRQRPS